MRILVLLERRQHGTPTPLIRRVCAALREGGAQVEAEIPEEMLLRCDSLSVEHDLYLLKSYTELAFSVAGILDDLGGRILNPYPSCVVLRDKALTAARLRAAGIPSPPTWLTADPMSLAPIVDQCAVVVKPLHGLHGRGVRRVENQRELAAIPPGEPLVAQEHVPGPGRDLKLYVAGDSVFAVRKPFSPTSFIRDGEPCAVPKAAKEIALECGRALDLRLYGLDLIESVDGPVVVDVNYFPGFRGVADPVPAIADCVETYSRCRSGSRQERVIAGVRSG